jgi:carboxypeptidase T
MKKILIFAALFICVSMLSAGSTVKYSKIKIFVPDRSLLAKILESGIDHEGSSGKIGGWMEFIAGPYELQQLAKKNIAYSTVIDDLQKEDIKHLYRGPMNALGFGYGSMGGYYTFDEVVHQLDSMQSQYPNLITARQSIATTSEGRSLWIVKISQNAGVDDPSKPEVLYTGLHHAREPEGMMTVMYYMWWLLQNYGTDPDATYLLNNRQIWFLPVFNPDGYVYNQTTNPEGGGYWRKNRRNNLDGSYGVDLNRNYGNDDMWNSPYGGSDTYTGSDVYRGLAPFSEPETNGIMLFLWEHNIKTCLNYHTYGDDYVYPWGYLPWESPDSVTFRSISFDITGYNRYVSGVDMQTVGYVTRGNSDDYMYGDSSKPITFAMTPEVGPSFWPSSDLIFPLAAENLEPNKYFSFVAGQYSVVKSFDLLDQNHNGGIENGESFSLAVTVRNKGLGDAGKIHAVISTASPDIIWDSDADSIDVLSARAEAQVVFSGKLSPNIIHGTAIHFVVTLTDPSGYLHRDTLPAILGTPYTLFEDHGDSGTSRWNTGLGWGLTSTAHSAPHAFTDSPSGDYSPGEDNSLTLNQPVNLAGYDNVVLKFWTQWLIEPRYDFATVEISSNGGSSWSTLRTSLSHSGSGDGVQTLGTWGFDGYTPGMEWVEQEADISAYRGSNILLRFRVTSDGGSERDGLYVDDITVVGYKDSMTARGVDVSVQQQWDLISLPVLPYDYKRTAVFPTSSSSAYSYENGVGYVLKDTLIPGKGYWVRFPAAIDQGIIGIPFTAETIAVHEGWNLIGSISAPIPCASIMCDPPGLVTSQFFGYSNGYVVVDTIQPGKGYWVNMSGNANIILSSVVAGVAHLSTANRIRIVATDELPPPPPEDASYITAKVPVEYKLEQAYPNPFNPATIIRYQIPFASNVILKIYNLLGQVVQVLIDDREDAGYKQVEWNAEKFSSGMYFYTMSAANISGAAGGFTQMKKMVLIK